MKIGWFFNLGPHPITHCITIVCISSYISHFSIFTRQVLLCLSFFYFRTANMMKSVEIQGVKAILFVITGRIPNSVFFSAAEMFNHQLICIWEVGGGSSSPSSPLSCLSSPSSSLSPLTCCLLAFGSARSTYRYVIQSSTRFRYWKENRTTN